MVPGSFSSTDSQSITEILYYEGDWVIGWSGLKGVYLSSIDTLYIETNWLIEDWQNPSLLSWLHWFLKIRE